MGRNACTASSVRSNRRSVGSRPPATQSANELLPRFKLKRPAKLPIRFQSWMLLKRSRINVDMRFVAVGLSSPAAGIRSGSFDPIRRKNDNWLPCAVSSSSETSLRSERCTISSSGVGCRRCGDDSIERLSECQSIVRCTCMDTDVGFDSHNDSFHKKSSSGVTRSDCVEFAQDVSSLERPALPAHHSSAEYPPPFGW